MLDFSISTRRRNSLELDGKRSLPLPAGLVTAARAAHHVRALLGTLWRAPTATQVSPMSTSRSGSARATKIDRNLSVQELARNNEELPIDRQACAMRHSCASGRYYVAWALISGPGGRPVLGAGRPSVSLCLNNHRVDELPLPSSPANVHVRMFARGDASSRVVPHRFTRRRTHLLTCAARARQTNQLSCALLCQNRAHTQHSANHALPLRQIKYAKLAITKLQQP